jgi:hypothetical protein
MELKPKKLNSQSDVEALISDLQAMQVAREIKLTRGSLSLGAIIDAEFTANGQRWRVHGVNDVHGGVTLDRIS